MKKERTGEEYSSEKNNAVKKIKIMTQHLAMNIRPLMEIFISENTNSGMRSGKTVSGLHEKVQCELTDGKEK